MIEQVLDDAEYFTAILEVSREPVDVDDYVDQWHLRQDVQSELVLLVGA